MAPRIAGAVEGLDRVFADRAAEARRRKEEELSQSKAVSLDDLFSKMGEDGKREKEVVKVKPEQIKEALSEARKRYAAEHAKDDRGLAERADAAKEASDSMEKGDARPLDRESR